MFPASRRESQIYRADPCFIRDKSLPELFLKTWHWEASHAMAVMRVKSQLLSMH